jgi:hypothetical protein
MLVLVSEGVHVPLPSYRDDSSNTDRRCLLVSTQGSSRSLVLFHYLHCISCDLENSLKSWQLSADRCCLTCD